MASCLLPRILVTTAYPFRTCLLAGLILVGASCGGGDGSTTGSTTPATALPAFVAYTPSAGVIASKKTVASPSFSGAPALLGPQACLATLSNNVHDQTHTTTFAGAGVSETDQQEIADYAEAAVKELRTKLSVSASIGFDNW